MTPKERLEHAAFGLGLHSIRMGRAVFGKCMASEVDAHNRVVPLELALEVVGELEREWNELKIAFDVEHDLCEHKNRRIAALEAELAEKRIIEQNPGAE